MRIHLRARLERLEALLKPVGRAFCMFDDSNLFENYDGPSLDERLAAFKAERGVGSHDTVIILRSLRTITESRRVVVRRNDSGVGDSGMWRRGVVRSHDRRGGDSAAMGDGRGAA